jgi:tRNA(Met) C34 N-acetyltransferase TmcA
MVLRPLGAGGGDLCRAARRHFRQNLPYQLAEPLRMLEPALATALLRGLTLVPALAPPERAALRLFAAGGSSYEDSLALLWKFACAVLSTCEGGFGLQEAQRALLVMKLLQRRDWQSVAQVLGLDGRAAVTEALRAAVASALADERSRGGAAAP